MTRIMFELISLPSSCRNHYGAAIAANPAWERRRRARASIGAV
jgi:hypothetical protein